MIRARFGALGKRDPGWVPLRRYLPGQRRLLSAGLAATAVAAGLQVIAPDPPPGRAVVVAARTVPAGGTIRSEDVAQQSRTPQDVPGTAVTDTDLVIGQTAAIPLAPGEVVTTNRLVTSALLQGRSLGDVIASVRLADPDAAKVLTAGQHVDILVAREGAVTAKRVATRATVLARPEATSAESSLPNFGAPSDGNVGSLVLLAVPEQVAAELVQAASIGPLSAVLRG